MKKLKFFIGISLFVEALMTITVICVLAVQKRSIPKAIIAALAAGSAISAWCLISGKTDEKRRKLRESDAFYDDSYNISIDEDEDENYDDMYDLGFNDDDNLIPDREIRF